ncbi:MAG: hypothetical protein A3I86_00335 [Candidatus Zambryskibacteria bacterium RIFCSPLOWO2_02_FULL_39_14]|uniref:Uncharacterized protein n=1 Tax=Candidatus Zambryskibacteria bacterium RIFCSPLOWO2_02_FULL_39_14 TaxID=1802769 RepID=A0A1G2UGR4_9BACT|nr:MAG: hypothetical protein A3I86_00335 [Candidatus Zambryskibacteria bacterium RIFCSPLOWO2_02_FULL_39_14]
MIHRILGSIIVFVSIIILPYWVYIPLLFIAIIIFPFFWEGIVLVLLIDVLYGNGVKALSWSVSPLAFSVLVLLIVLLYLRDSLRSYA